MAIKTIKIIVAEGNHDTAFIARVMKSNGYTDPKTRINNIQPAFLRNYVKKMFGEFSFERCLPKVNRRLLPSFLLSQDVQGGEEVALLFASDGLDNFKNIERILGFFIQTMNNQFGQENIEDIERIKVIFNFDADDKGIDQRIEFVNECIRKLTDNQFPGLSNYGRQDYKGLSWGTFISSNKDGYGALEEFVLPLFEDGMSELVQSVDRFLEQMDSYNIPPRIGKFDEKKARIGIMGQLDIPGSSNTVLIDQSKMISDEALVKDIYKEIGDYIRNF